MIDFTNYTNRELEQAAKEAEDKVWELENILYRVYREMQKRGISDDDDEEM